ncbi:MAG: bifunctional UDP-N-acetylmuramoyl-tripeptide:D-alanyl-D-alanine ligase/alanine racemase [Flavobacteriales bacterium]|nr:bifunctional UDP-N-acetylmuramoyl-tripeptide:D-alanyl-D-alanine ligase/alanine racemase [Flavobacteriales bacterium]
MLNAGKLAKWIGAELQGSAENGIAHILTDSRTGHIPEHSAFFAFSGTAHDGHVYIRSLLQRGVRVFIVERIPDLGDATCSFLLVSDTLAALQRMAAQHRMEFGGKVIGITGSNGKTIVKEWAYQLLHKHRRIYRSPKSYNSQLGVPISVWNIEASHEVAILEAGISETGEMARLEAMIKPQIGLFTNIGDAHASGFTDIDQKIEEKLLLFSDARKLIYRRSPGELQEHIVQFAKRRPQLELCSWSTDTVQPSDSDLFRVSQINRKLRETHFVIERGLESWKAMIPYSDEASLENALHAFAIGMILHVPVEDMLSGLKELQAIEMRLNQKEGANGCTLISDFYNSDLKSFEIALEWMAQLQQGGRRTVILSDIQQSDRSDEQLYTRVNELLNGFRVDRLIGIGKHIAKQAERFNVPVRNFYDSTGEFLKKTSVYEFNDETILLKGARNFRFERIEQFLEKQMHRTVLEINLNALTHNFRYFRSILPARVRIMAMVKAFSYGSGGHEIARQLAFHGVDYLGVAYADEGVALRKAGITVPVMVMNPDPGAFSLMLEQELEPAIYRPELLARMAQVANSKGISEVKVHLEFNTGMNRLGMEEKDLGELFRVLTENELIRIQSVFTHLTSSDLPEHDKYTTAQLDRFDRLYEKIAEQLGYQPLKHTLNSSGATRFPERSGDMVRVGIGLYGVDPSGKASAKLQPVGTLRSIISQIRTLKAGESVGYGRHSIADHDRRIAVVAIGYADGLDRRLSRGGGSLMIHGKPAPIVGNICMDMTMCDVSGISCREGDEVIVFGSKPGIEELAARLETIPYEILTSVSARVKRVYLRE